MNILIIDDHNLIRAGIIIELQKHFKEINISESNSAIDVLYNKTSFIPDIIILDIDLPKMNGFEASKLLKDKFSKSRILGFSGYSFDYSKNKNIIYFDGFSFKKNGEELVDVISRIANGEKVFSKVQSSGKQETNIEPANNEYGFTEKELQFLALFKNNFTIKQIADKLCIMDSTAKVHKKHINKKASVNSNAELMDFIHKTGIV